MIERAGSPESPEPTRALNDLRDIITDRGVGVDVKRRLEQLLSEVPRDEVAGLNLYRFGVEGGSSYEVVQLSAEASYPPHRHNGSEARFSFIIGNGSINIDGVERSYKPGDTFVVGKGISHGFSPRDETFFLAIQTPPIKNQETGVEDIHF